jgi:LuxR family maltose regulon positive regulatory protein
VSRRSHACVERALNLLSVNGDLGSDMLDDPLHLAKITAPKLPDIVDRSRLYGMLDTALARPVIWVSGPAGCGKTTLVASYTQRQRRRCLWYQVDMGDADPAALFHYLRLALRKASPRSRRPLPPAFAPEFMFGMTVFVRRFFRTVFSRLAPPCFLVFDNLQDVPSETAFPDLLREGLSEVPPGANVILISRSEPMPTFSRFRAERSLAQIGWNDLRFSKAEAERLLRLLGNEHLAGAVLARTMDATQGWAAGLILMSLTAGPECESQPPLLLGEALDRSVLDYFATELLRQTELSQQDFLLKTAFLPNITAETAEDLTGNPQAADILNHLARRNMFVVRRPPGNSYEFHPLARRFLLDQAAKSYCPRKLVKLKRSAAGSLAKNGQLNEAIALLQEIEDWEVLVPLIERHAPALLSEARHQTLESWLKAVPEQILEEHTWLRYWLGISQALTKPAEAYPALVQAYRQFREAQDVAGAFLAWSSVIEILGHSQQYTAIFDQWLDEFANLVADHPEYPSPAIECRVAASMMTALAYYRAWDRTIHQWGERASILAEQAGNRDVQCHALLGRLHAMVLETYNAERAVLNDRVVSLLRHGAVSEFVQLEGWVNVTVGHCYAGRHRECVKAGTEALTFAERTGILLYNPLLLYWIGLSSLNAGDFASACRTIDEMTPLLRSEADPGRAYQSLLHAYQRYLKNDLRGAALAVAKSLAYLGDGGMTMAHIIVRFLAAHIFSELGRPEQAYRQLAGVKAFAERAENPLIMHNCLMCEAEIALNQDDERGAIPPLREALSLARNLVVNYALVWHPLALAHLCALALEHGIEVETVQRIVRERQLPPDARAQRLDSWPWPLKIQTLGEFSLFRNGERVEFSRKAPRKPLDLLKALIAYGGKGVGIERLKDALWPDAEGDAAQHAFNMTLHRLRNLIGIDGALVLTGGRLTLSPRLCWVDAWVLKELVVAATKVFQRRESAFSLEEIDRFEDKALDLYRGPFLEGLSDEPSTLSARKDMATTIRRFEVECGRFWEREGMPERAAVCYERARTEGTALKIRTQ